jgi:hypothetical protein
VGDEGAHFQFGRQGDGLPVRGLRRPDIGKHSR